MPVDIVIPAAGESVTSGLLSRWLVNDGDYVKRDQDVLELETDKVTMSLPAPAAGVVRTKVKAGETVTIGQIVGSIDEKAAAPAAAAKPAAPAPAHAGNGKANTPPAPTPAGEDVRATPLARKLAEEHGVDLSSIPGTGPSGRV